MVRSPDAPRSALPQGTAGDKATTKGQSGMRRARTNNDPHQTSGWGILWIWQCQKLDVSAQLLSRTFRHAGLPERTSEWQRKKGKNKQSLTPRMLTALSDQGRARLCTRQRSSAMP